MTDRGGVECARINTDQASGVPLPEHRAAAPDAAFVESGCGHPDEEAP